MLTLGVNSGDYITIGPDIVVQVLRTGNQFRLAIDAPRDMKITRSEHLSNEETPDCIERVRNLKPDSKQSDFKRVKRSD